MKQKRLLGIGSLLALLLAFVMVACGPAVPAEKAGDATRIASGEGLFAQGEQGEEAEAVAEAENMGEVVEGPLPEAAPPFSDRMPAELAEDEYEVSDSGLKYFDVTEGDGASPEDGDILQVNYAMWVDDGAGPQILDDTFFFERPFTFVVGSQQVFPGWEEGMMTMQLGGSRQMLIPPDLAFGPEGVPGMVPPAATLIMEVELLDVQSPPEPADLSDSDYETTDSGLQIAILNEGDGGDAAEMNDTVTVDFTLWVADSGRFFTGSTTSGEPFVFPVGSEMVFPGWNEGVVGMTVGEKRQLLIPAELGLGEDSFGEIVPPNSDLLMQVEMLDIQKPRKATVVDEGDYTVTDSGLKYVDLVEGDGDMPEAGQTVVVHYTGWLEDGVQFDSSLDRGQPFPFTLGTGSVIAGWDEGVATMKVGTVRQLVIPAELGYGASGSGPIPPGATLIFEVELLDIQ